MCVAVPDGSEVSGLGHPGLGAPKHEASKNNALNHGNHVLGSLLKQLYLNTGTAAELPPRFGIRAAFPSKVLLRHPRLKDPIACYSVAVGVCC